MAWWSGYRKSANVEDRQKAKAATVKAAKVGGPLAFVFAAGFCTQQAVAPAPETLVKETAQAVDAFIAPVFGDMEDRWREIIGSKWRSPRLVLYTANTSTKGCGRATTAIGPFYCPPDEQIYLDLSFFAIMKTKACQQQGGDCEFARAYVIAHEVGHHVQKLFGFLEKGDAVRVQQGPGGGAVRVELQADCFAGVWAARTNTKHKNVTPQMVTAAWQAAKFGGDDQFGAPPSEYTHGASAQRTKWFLRGYDGKTVDSCDTFKEATP